jgi:hypothetical protein
MKLLLPFAAVSLWLGSVAGSASAEERSLFTEDWEEPTEAWTLEAPEGTELEVTSTYQFGAPTKALRFGNDTSGADSGSRSAAAARQIPDWSDQITVAFDLKFDGVARSMNSNQHPVVDLIDGADNVVARMFPGGWGRIWVTSASGETVYEGEGFASLNNVNRFALTYDAVKGEIRVTGSDAEDGFNPMTVAAPKGLDVEKLVLRGGNAGRRTWENQDAYIDNIAVTTTAVE